LLGHRVHGQSSQAEVMFQKQGVDVLKWHMTLKVGCKRACEDSGGQGWGPEGFGLWGGLVTATCWWMDTLPASAIFMILLANSTSGEGRGEDRRSLDAAGVWAQLGEWGGVEGVLTIAGSLLCPGQQLLGIAAPCLGVIQGCIHAPLCPNESQVQFFPWGTWLDPLNSDPCFPVEAFPESPDQASGPCTVPSQLPKKSNLGLLSWLQF
jgi:hypothetical protein